MQWQKSYKQPWTPYTGRGKGNTSIRTSSRAQTFKSAYGEGSTALVLSASDANADTDTDIAQEHKCGKRRRSEERRRSRSPSWERRHRRQDAETSKGRSAPLERRQYLSDCAAHTTRVWVDGWDKDMIRHAFCSTLQVKCDVYVTASAPVTQK